MNKKALRIVENYSHKYSIFGGAVYDDEDLKQEIHMHFWKSFKDDIDAIETPILKMAAFYAVVSFVRRNDMRKRGHIKLGFNRPKFYEYCDDIEGPRSGGDTLDKIWIEKAISKLKAKHRFIIIAYYFSGLQISDIARHLGITDSGVSFNHRRALKELKRLLIHGHGHWKKIINQ